MLLWRSALAAPGSNVTLPGIPDAVTSANASPKALDTNATGSLAREVAFGSEYLGAPPSNISGNLKGAWVRQRVGGEVGDVPWLTKDSGLTALQLSTTASGVEGLHDVEGQLLTREGLTLTEDPEVFKLVGVYVAATGRLHARVEPDAGPLMVSLAENETAAHPAAHRQALRQRAALWATPGEEPPLFYFMRQDLTEYLTQMDRECSFVLDMRVQAAKQALKAGSKQLQAPQDGQAKDARKPGVVGPLNAPEGDLQDEDVYMNGTLSSPECGIMLGLNGTTTHVEEHYAKAINYTLMVTAVSFLQVLLSIRQMEATTGQAAASKVSLLMLGHQAIMDAHLCLLHLTTGIVIEPLFNAFATTAFFEFVVFAIFEMRYLLSVWRARRANALDPWAAQRELSVLYARFYGALLGGIFLMYQLQGYMKYLVFPMYSFWVPQILYCAYHEARQPLRPLYVVGMTLTRLALPLYIFGCPYNVLRLQTDLGICAMLCLSMAVQVALLLAQTKWGPRCFIPRQFLPAKYDYHRKALARPPELTVQGEDASAGEQGDIETGDAGVECVICMNPLDTQRLSARMTAFASPLSKQFVDVTAV
ncbi:hypothetical protein CVIRNUC_002285 [Coccomyxa viridis]|uniref:RING-type E3 ubiquitin transferase n=1 Tax=Coccomyxa viridis TaxID=1274662 RepID=A0AAV1HZV6_9CHLO|nr:hypothetical protein CVIRNUC_002285 [Coccomyxa viridis]